MRWYEYKMETDDLYAPDDLKAKLLAMTDQLTEEEKAQPMMKTDAPVPAQSAPVQPKKKLIRFPAKRVGALAACLAVCVVGYGAFATGQIGLGAKSSNPAAVMAAGGADRAAVDSPMAADYSLNTLSLESSADNGTAVYSEDDAAAAAHSTDHAKIIYTANLSLESKDYDAARAALDAALAEAGGYLESSSEYSDAGDSRSVSLTYRVPQQNYENFLAAVAEAGNVTYKNQQADDVTAQYMDVETRLENLKNQRTRLQQLQQQADNLSDLLEIESSLPYGIFVFNWANPNQRSWGLPMLGFDLVGRNNQIRSYVPNKDGITDMYEMGVAMTHSVSVNKVFNGAGIRFNYTGIDYDGMLKNFDNMKRHTFDLRVNMDLAKWLSSEISVNYQLETADNRDYKGDSNRNPMRAIMNMPRDVVMEELLPWKRETGEAFTRGNGFYNPYWLLNEISNGDGRNNFRGNLTLNIKPIQGMNIRLRASVEKANKNGWKFDNYYTMWDIDGQYETFREASNNYNYEGVISYNRNIKKVSLSANLGTSMQKNDWYKLWNTTANFPH